MSGAKPGDIAKRDFTETPDAADRGVVIAAGKEDIRQWFIAGVEQGRRYMLVVYDRMEIPDDSDQPYYCDDTESAYKLLSAFRRDPMCEVMEVYDLSADREAQLGERRAWHLSDVSEEEGAAEPPSALEELEESE